MKAKEPTQQQNQIMNYFKGVKSEWFKVTWPQRKQVGMETVIVLVVVTIFTLIVYAMDTIFNALLNLIQR